MQHDLLGSILNLGLRSNVYLDLWRSPCICFDASRRGKHDGAKIIPLQQYVKKICVKNDFPRKRSFFNNPLEPKLLILAQIWEHTAERASKKLSIAFFGLLLAAIVIAPGRNYRRLTHFRKISAVWPHLNLEDIGLGSRKLHLIEFFTARSCPLSFVILAHRSWDLRGGGSRPFPPLRVIFRRPPRRVLRSGAGKIMPLQDQGYVGNQPLR